MNLDGNQKSGNGIDEVRSGDESVAVKWERGGIALYEVDVKEGEMELECEG